MIVYPAIDLRRGRCVRLRQGRPQDETVYDGDPAAVARRWVAEGATWLHVVNLDGALEEGDRTLNLQRLAEIRQAVPGTCLQFGGGLRSLAAVERVLALGATRVVLGTAAVDQPHLVAEAVARFGAERIVAGIDARDGRVATHGWQETTAVTAETLGRAVRAAGVLRAVYTDISRDGMLAGANVEATVTLARATGLQIIASGGVASLADVQRLADHAAAGIAAAGIEGVIVGQALYTGVLSLAEAIRLAQEAG